MFDLRYHITSLVAAFLALGIGLFAGSMLASDDMLVREQKFIIDRLEQDFAFLREQNQGAQEEIKSLRSTINHSQVYSQTIFPVLVKDRLKGTRVAIVKTTAFGDLSHLLNTLQLAGVQVTSTSELLGDFTFRDSLLHGKIVAGLKNTGVENPGQLSAYLAKSIAEGIYEGTNQTATRLLDELGIWRSAGVYGQPIDALIIVGGSRNEAENCFRSLDSHLVRYFKDKGIRIIDTEFAEVPVSYMRYYLGETIPTVDNVDTLPGQTSLIMLLAGMNGHYGVKPWADRLVPDLTNGGPIQEVFRLPPGQGQS